MAIPVTSSAGYNTAHLTSNEPKNKPTAGRVLAPKYKIDLTGAKEYGVLIKIKPEHEGRYDNFEQSEKPSTPKEIVQTPPKELVHTPISTIHSKTFNANLDHLDETLKKANSMNLSYGERMSFLKQEGRNWVEDIRQNEPEMYVAWLQLNKQHIETGNLHMANLPSNFTMSDYYSYVKDE